MEMTPNGMFAMENGESSGTGSQDIFDSQRELQSDLAILHGAERLQDRE